MDEDKSGAVITAENWLEFWVCSLDTLKISRFFIN